MAGLSREMYPALMQQCPEAWRRQLVGFYKRIFIYASYAAIHAIRYSYGKQYTIYIYIYYKSQSTYLLIEYIANEKQNKITYSILNYISYKFFISSLIGIPFSLAGINFLFDLLW